MMARPLHNHAWSSNPEAWTLESFMVRFRMFLSAAGLAAGALMGSGCHHTLGSDGTECPEFTTAAGPTPVPWKTVPNDSKAMDISIGSDGTVYRVGMDRRTGGYEIGKYQCNGKWKTQPDGARKVVANGPGSYLILTEGDSLIQVDRADRKFLGLAKDATWKNALYIADTGVYHPWVGYYIARRIDNAWTRIDGAAHKLAVTPSGDLWAINYRSYEIYLLPGGASAWEAWAWKTIPGLGMEITSTFDGTIYRLGLETVEGGKQIYKWNPAEYSWNKVEGGAIKICGGPGKTLWIVRSDNSIAYSSNPPTE